MAKAPDPLFEWFPGQRVPAAQESALSPPPFKVKQPSSSGGNRPSSIDEKQPSSSGREKPSSVNGRKSLSSRVERPFESAQFERRRVEFVPQLDLTVPLPWGGSSNASKDETKYVGPVPELDLTGRLPWGEHSSKASKDKTKHHTPSGSVYKPTVKTVQIEHNADDTGPLFDKNPWMLMDTATQERQLHHPTAPATNVQFLHDLNVSDLSISDSERKRLSYPNFSSDSDDSEAYGASGFLDMATEFSMNADRAAYSMPSRFNSPFSDMAAKWNAPQANETQTNKQNSVSGIEQGRDIFNVDQPSLQLTSKATLGLESGLRLLKLAEIEKKRYTHIFSNGILCTLVTKDTIVREALEMSVYDFEEVNEYFVVMQSLSYAQVSMLEQLSIALRRKKQRKTQQPEENQRISPTPSSTSADSKVISDGELSFMGISTEVALVDRCRSANPLKCQLCGLSLRRWSNLQQHQKCAHPDIIHTLLSKGDGDMDSSKPPRYGHDLPSPYNEDASTKFFAQKLAEKICERYASQFRQSPIRKCVASKQEDRSSQAQSLKNKQESNQPATLKRPLPQDQGDGNDESDQGEDQATNPKQKRRVDTLSTRLFACPYAKRDPERFSERNQVEKCYRNCAGKYLNSIPRVKQHLYRTHARPAWYCGNCYLAFKTREDLNEHIRQRPPCDQQTPKYEEMMTDQQYQEIKRRDLGNNAHDAWYRIFSILFPDAPPPVSPYVCSADPAAITHFVSFFRWAGPEELYALLRARRENMSGFPPLSTATQAIVDEAFEIALPNCLREGQQDWQRLGDDTAPTTTLQPDAYDSGSSSPVSDTVLVAHPGEEDLGSHFHIEPPPQSYDITSAQDAAPVTGSVHGIMPLAEELPEPPLHPTSTDEWFIDPSEIDQAFAAYNATDFSHPEPSGWVDLGAAQDPNLYNGHHYEHFQ